MVFSSRQASHDRVYPTPLQPAVSVIPSVYRPCPASTPVGASTRGRSAKRTDIKRQALASLSKVTEQVKSAKNPGQRWELAYPHLRRVEHTRLLPLSTMEESFRRGVVHRS